jgi:hypothetical protein
VPDHRVDLNPDPSSFLINRFVDRRHGYSCLALFSDITLVLVVAILCEPVEHMSDSRYFLGHNDDRYKRVSGSVHKDIGDVFLGTMELINMGFTGIVGCAMLYLRMSYGTMRCPGGSGDFPEPPPTSLLVHCTSDSSMIGRLVNRAKRFIATRRGADPMASECTNSSVPTSTVL